MTEFKVGDRVAVYSTTDMLKKFRRIGIVARLPANGTLEIEYPESPKRGPEDSLGRDLTVVHPKQCRRLKPKRKAREFWVTVDVCAVNGVARHAYEYKPVVPYFRVREVLPPKEKA